MVAFAKLTDRSKVKDELHVAGFVRGARIVGDALVVFEDSQAGGFLVRGFENSGLDDVQIVCKKDLLLHEGGHVVGVITQG